MSHLLFLGLAVTQLNATMSGGLDILALNEEDVTKMLAATTHLGAENVNFQVGTRTCEFITLKSKQYLNMMSQESVPYYMSENIDDPFSQLTKSLK